MSKDTSGSVFPCSVCDAPAVRKSGHQYLCAKHYRFGQMRHTSKYHGKIAPTRAELEEMPGANLECPECGTDQVIVYEKHAVMANTYEHYCHSVKAHDDDAEARCLECDWVGQRKDLGEQS